MESTPIQSRIVAYLPFALLGLYLLLSLSYFLIHPLLPGYLPYDIKRLLEITLLGVMVCHLIASPRYCQRWLHKFIGMSRCARGLLLLILALGILSACLAQYPRFAVLEVGTWVGLFYLTLYIASTDKSVIFDKAIFSVIYASMVYFLGVFVYQYAVNLSSGTLQQLNYFPGFMNVRFFSQYQIWTLPLVLLPFLCLSPQRWFMRGISYVIAVLWWMLAFYSQAKGVGVALVISFSIVSLCYFSVCKRWLVHQLVVAGLGALSFGVLFVWLPHLLSTLPWAVDTVGGVTADTRYQALPVSVSTRLDLWWHGVAMIKANPFLGVGPLHFSIYPDLIAAHPHNSLLQIAAEWGLLVMLAVLALCVWGLIAVFKYFTTLIKHDDQQRVLLLSVLTGLLAGFIYSLVSGVIVMPLGQVMLCVMVAWVLRHYQEVKMTALESTTVMPWWQHLLLLGFGVLALLDIFRGIYPDVRYLPQLQMQRAADANFNYAMHPRYWTDAVLRPEKP
ncbi:MAG: hypothetical protein CMF50_00845 [Legionellales bacterium]|nr:hypothetical protein [Legionellales bacterium]|tara:strand:- start:37537 stop:39045 length:1509 start_codon:yes stop_codon:yes gene_type:complete